MVPKRKSQFFHKVRIYLREYCNKTAVHGFQYFGERNRTVFEKVWWFIAITACLTCCTYVILTMYRRYEVSPVIVTFATKTTPIYKIPFPAVTICPTAVFVRSKLNYTRLSEKAINDSFTEDESKYFDYANQICSPTLYSNNKTIIQNITDFYHTLHEVKPNLLEDSMCRWLGSYKNCKEIFTEIITDMGICYSFNLIDRKEMYRDETEVYKEFQNVNRTSDKWMDNGGFNGSRHLESYPYSAALPGVEDSLEIAMFTSDEELDYKCTGVFQGYRVAFHVPERYPLFKEDHILVPLGQLVVASLQPNMVTTSSVVKKFDPQLRICYFPHEKNLTFFKIYTQKNCRNECWANYILYTCKCVSFYMPRSNDTPVCSSDTVRNCILKATEKIKLDQDEETSSNGILQCDCLPLCSDLSYDVFLSQAQIGFQEFAKAYGLSQEFTNGVHLTLLRVYFKSGHFITSQRNELYGPIEFLANFGGIIALFTGASIVSVVEIIYFLTWRLLCNIKLFGPKHWSGHDDLAHNKKV